MPDVYCAGTIQKGRLAGSPCQLFLGTLSPPYENVMCRRCGHRNNSREPRPQGARTANTAPEEKGDATENGHPKG